jgi:hypothetical protein
MENPSSSLSTMISVGAVSSSVTRRTKVSGPPSETSSGMRSGTPSWRRFFARKGSMLTRAGREPMTIETSTSWPPSIWTFLETVSSCASNCTCTNPRPGSPLRIRTIT